MNPIIRADFPMLSRTIDGIPLVYLDSAATSLKPRAAIDAERAYSTDFTANVHRGTSTISEEASYHYEAARRLVARFIGAEPACVIMTPNTSISLGMVAAGLGLTSEDTVLCSPNSHHSNLLPWMRRGTIAYVDGDPLEPLDPDVVRKAIEVHRPRVIAFGWVSNVNGAVSPAAKLCKIAREFGVISVVDAAQAAPHLPIDVKELDCDFLAFSGHKMLGPTGTGVLWGRREALECLEPLVIGGGTVDRVSLRDYTMKGLPSRLEPGTPNIAGAIGLGAALEYLIDLGRDQIAAHGRELSMAMRAALDGLADARILMAGTSGLQIPIASVVPIGWGISSDVICRTLSDTFRVMTRSGFHCAHPLFDGQGFEQGAVRLSAYIYNSVEEINLAAQALCEIVSVLGGRRSVTTAYPS
ncbi:aminotransferase class V-fold PLP-dependent enzyme [Mesorhizobium temperatum]|uniref:Aminotransferase class V domain-containing protein n=1 Tax=Mesorhizobium temperatum TaxID=241416 RepID=A0A271LF49_9HYPH|nr:aminotransferase class V-fold PLP-dependent enzyme [Mesorhizobium temperatum]PAQ06731.1 hypothetical protein CIT26_24435 [Mesorhizobium temperatum]